MRMSNGAEPPATVGVYRQSPLIETVLSTPALYSIAAQAGCFRPTDDALDKVRSLMVPVLAKLAAAAVHQAVSGSTAVVVGSVHVLAAAKRLSGQHGTLLGAGSMLTLLDPSFQFDLTEHEPYVIRPPPYAGGDAAAHVQSTHAFYDGLEEGADYNVAASICADAANALVTEGERFPKPAGTALLELFRSVEGDWPRDHAAHRTHRYSWTDAP